MHYTDVEQKTYLHHFKPRSETKSGLLASYRHGGDVMDAEEELKKWIVLYAVRLVRLACTYTRNQNDAEDVVQDALIKAYRAIHQLTNQQQPFPWLARIVINECKSVYRKKRREVLTSTMPNHAIVSAEETVIRQTECDLVYEAVMNLPEKYRLPVVLFHFEELPIHHIADILKVSESAIKTRLFRARNRLAESLSEVRASDYRSPTAEC